MATQTWFAKARELFQQGKLEAALDVLEDGLKNEPICIDGWELKARILQSLERYGEAVEANQTVMQLSEAGITSSQTAWLVTAEDFYEAGYLSRDSRQYEEGLAFYKRALSIKPDFYDFWHGKANILRNNLDRPEEALVAYEKAISIKPDYYYAWGGKGYSLEDLGRSEEALSAHEKAISIKLNYYQAWNGKGNALRDLGRQKEALVAYEKAISIKPDYHCAWNGKGNVLGDLGRLEEALLAHEKAISIKPDYHYAWGGKGHALRDLGQSEEALLAHEKAISIKFDYYQAWNGKGNALRDLGRPKEALVAHEKAISIKPDYHYAWNGKGNVLWDLGQPLKAVVAYENALSIKFDYYYAWSNRALAICALRNSNALNTDFLGKIELGPNVLLLQKTSLLLQRIEPHIAALRDAFKYVVEGSVVWAQIYLELGDAYLKHSKSKQNPGPYWRDAIRSYQTSYLILTVRDFPEDHLQILQGLIRAYLAFEDIPAARVFQKEGQPLFEQIRAAKPERLKPAFERKFASFSQLEIDLLIGENAPIAALEQAEFYKNRCLTWILDEWQASTESPDYAEIRALVTPQTAIIYWHLGVDSLTTFLLTAEQAEPIVLETDRRQQVQRFWSWLGTYDSQYHSYASQKPKATEHLANHPWRKSLQNQLTQLEKVLKIEAICDQLPETVQNLILVPHRDLHRVPLQALFAEKFICTFLPSLKIGLKLKAKQPSQAITPLLNVDDPKTEQSEMPFAQIESAVIQSLVQGTTTINGQSASLQTVTQALQGDYKAFHFTGHGAYNSRNPAASALGLSDEPLTAKQIHQLDLSSCQLVCLAACETALTGKDGIPDEYVGLASAFLKAGAANVLSTLWPVDEIASAWMMIRFYQGLLANKTAAIALKASEHWLRTVSKIELADWIIQLSQLSGLPPLVVERLEARAQNVLEEGSTMEPNQLTDYGHPYYWAAFTLTGWG